MFVKIRLLATLLVPLLGALATGCGSCAPADAPDGIVAHVGEVPITLSEVELYLALNVFTEEDENAAALDRVKSRLFDVLADQKRLLTEAARRRLQVSDREIDALQASDAEHEAVVAEIAPSRRRQLVRERLMIHKLQERLAQRWPPLTDEAVRVHVERSRGALPTGQRLRLRSLRFASPEEAATAARRIRQGRMTFVEAVLTYETDPGQGLPLELSWETLSDDLHDALEPLKPGEVSRPVDFHGETYLFQLESWLDDAKARDADLVDRTRTELERLRRQTAIDGLLRRLRRAMTLRIDEKKLPFRYVPEAAT